MILIILKVVGILLLAGLCFDVLIFAGALIILLLNHFNKKS